MTNYERALACAAKGWLVFPSKAKRPLVRWGTESTTDEHTIQRWWKEYPDADVCIKTGAESNLVVVDWDRYKVGATARWPLGEAYPNTLTTKTAKGGLHFYFKHPGYPVRNSAGLLAEFIDVRGDGGMVVAYPAIREVPLLDIPTEWVQERKNSVDYSVSLTPDTEYKGFTQWAEHIKTAGLADLRFAKEGKRNATLYSVASDLYKLVWAGALDKAETTNLLGDQALAIGLEPHEIAATLASAMRNGATQHQKGAADVRD